MQGKRFLFEPNLEANVKNRMTAWKFISIDSLTEKTVGEVVMTVNRGLKPFIDRNPDYNQTVINYGLTHENNEISISSNTGLIENEKNIWMHPPRSQFFRILELNPFPFIQAPYEIGNRWEWELSIGSFWGDTRWKTWDGSINNKYEYEITDRRKYNSELGKLQCFEITATATSSLGQTKLVSLFHPEYGFIKLDYRNIDGTKTVLEVSSIEY